MEKAKPGTFVGFALLSENNWDKEKYINDLKEQWSIKPYPHPPASANVHGRTKHSVS